MQRAVLLLLFLFSLQCNDKLPYLQQYSGQQGEVIVLCNKQQWQSSIGENIRNTLGKVQYGLPQEEPLFSIIHVLKEKFSRTISTHRNILEVFVADTINDKEGLIEIKKNEWSRQQLLIRISSPDDSTWIRAFVANREAIITQFQEMERKRIITYLEKYGEEKITEHLKKRYQLSLMLPKKSFIAKQTDNFCWIRVEDKKVIGGTAHPISKGIMVYYYNDTSTVLNNASILTMRDSICQLHIPGPSEGSFMTTYYKDYPPQSFLTTLNNKDAIVMRGLWKVEGDFMGGPFISLTTLDKKRNRIVAVEGYIFAPKFDKRELLREMEAVIYSLEFN